MKDFKVPGIVWVIFLLILGGMIQGNEAWIQANLGLSPLVIQSFIGFIFLAAKAASPGTKELNQAIDVIEKLLRRPAPPTEGMRSAESQQASTSVKSTEIPERPNPITRILVG